MSDAELTDLSATELVAGYRGGRISPTHVHDAVQERIDQLEPVVHAFAERSPEVSRAAAVASEQRWRRGEPLGPVDGVPVTLKENIARAGLPQRNGCAATDPAPAARDAPITRRLLESGAVILGSTTMPDWGMLSSGVSSLHGITRSPLNPQLTTGGSSAGAGAAAAAGYGPLHVGTDIGGSVRLPGTWLGLVAHKPSFGRIPLDVPYLGRVAGPMTRSGEDAALLMSVLARPDPADWSALPPADLPWTDLAADVAGLRVGLWLEAGAGMPGDPAVADLVTRAAAVFERGGAHVEPLSPWLTETALEQVDRFWRVRSLNDLTALPPDRQAQVLPYVAQWARGGQDATGLEVLRCYQGIGALQAATVAATADLDLVLSPVCPVAAFPATWPMPWGDDPSRGMAHIGFTLPFSMSGQPSCSVDCGSLSDGRRVGLQISGRRFDDVGVLRAVRWFEQTRPPTTPGSAMP